MAEHQVRNEDHQKRFNPPGVEKPFNHDAALVQEVKEALLRGTESAGIDIRVSAEDGAVRLYGVVDVLSHKTAAEEIVRRIPGVRRLENDITIANEEWSGDKHLLEEVTNRLGRRPEHAGMGCRVQGGVVTLVGSAETYDEVHSAVKMIEDTAGLREVRVGHVKVGEGRDDDDADVSRAAEKLVDRLGYDHNQFQIYTDAGTLHIKGFVRTRDDRSKLKIALHTIRGVDKVEALLVTDEETDGEVH